MKEVRGAGRGGEQIKRGEERERKDREGTKQAKEQRKSAAFYNMRILPVTV